jgi:hypothetical protein
MRNGGGAYLSGRYYPCRSRHPLGSDLRCTGHFDAGHGASCDASCDLSWPSTDRAAGWSPRSTASSPHV